MQRHVRSALALAVFAGLIAFIATQTQATDRFLGKDFLEYWGAGWLNLHGENPYDPAKLLDAQRIADPNRSHAVMMWNPPPSLALYMPIAAIPAPWASLLWVCGQLLTILTAAKLLWRVYAPNEPQWPPLVLAVCSLGTWWVITYGQNTGFIVLGLAGFLYFTKQDRPFAAGACAALTVLKPHLLAVFGVLLVTDAITRRGSKSLAAGTAAIAVALGIACATNPQVITQWVDAAWNPAEGATALSDWWLPVPSFWLRKWIAQDQFWIQFVPCAVACVAAVVYRVWKGSRWDWSRELPWVVAMSVLTTPYGGWLFDLPILLVPVTWSAARILAARDRQLLILFFAGQGIVTALSLMWPRGLHEYWWCAPASLALCLLAFAASDRRRGLTTESQRAQRNANSEKE